jgi:BlaI family penicillinase repressor
MTVQKRLASSPAKPDPTELTQAEWSIIKTVWNLQPCAAPSVQEALEKEKGWSYSTVRTFLDRMVEKGILSAEKIRNLTLYRAVLTQPEAQQSELRYALKHAFNGALTPMVQCLLETEHLSEEELKELEKLIREKRKKK